MGIVLTISVEKGTENTLRQLSAHMDNVVLQDTYTANTGITNEQAITDFKNELTGKGYMWEREFSIIIA